MCCQCISRVIEIIVFYVHFGQGCWRWIILCSNTTCLFLVSVEVRHCSELELCCSAPPFGCLPCTWAAVRGVEEDMGCEGDKYRGVPTSTSRPLPKGFHSPRHQGRRALRQSVQEMTDLVVIPMSLWPYLCHTGNTTYDTLS